MSKLTDKEKKEIVAKYVGNKGKITMKTLAEEYGVAINTISNVLKADPGFAKKVNNKKRENEQSVLAHFAEKRGVVNLLIDDILSLLQEHLPEATPRELFGGLKILKEIYTDPVTTPENADVNTKNNITIEILDNRGAPDACDTG